MEATYLQATYPFRFRFERCFKADPSLWSASSYKNMYTKWWNIQPESHSSINRCNL